MAKKQVEEIVENEEAKSKEEAEKKKNDVVRLRVLVAFIDKYTKQNYAINDEIFVDKNRAKELLSDSRRLVEKLD